MSHIQITGTCLYRAGGGLQGSQPGSRRCLKGAKRGSEGAPEAGIRCPREEEGLDGKEETG